MAGVHATVSAHRHLARTSMTFEQPLPSNMLEWHFVIEGPAGSPYQGGYYHGIIRFPQEYPYKPPSIRMLTPSGRFEPNQRICLSMSDFHPETWNCMWSGRTLIESRTIYYWRMNATVVEFMTYRDGFTVTLKHSFFHLARSGIIHVG